MHFIRSSEQLTWMTVNSVHWLCVCSVQSYPEVTVSTCHRGYTLAILRRFCHLTIIKLFVDEGRRCPISFDHNPDGSNCCSLWSPLVRGSDCKLSKQTKYITAWYRQVCIDPFNTLLWTWLTLYIHYICIHCSTLIVRKPHLCLCKQVRSRPAAELLRSNLFSNQSIISSKKRSELKGF